MKSSLTFLVFFISNLLVAQSIIFVDSSNVGSVNGQSWATAYSSFQQALEVAQPGQQIWVAKGTYVPSKDFSGNVPTDLKKTTFTLRKGVKIYGGFGGTETHIRQRNWRTNKSVLSGFHGPKQSEVVVRGDSIDSTASVDGFYITQAKGNNFNFRGGGIFLTYSNPHLINLVIHHNEAYNGGGVGMLFSSPFMINLSIHHNRASSSSGGFGGGIFAERSNPVLINCLITKNVASDKGGGLCSWISTPHLVNVTISGNYAIGSFRSSGIMNIGSVAQGISSPSISNSVIEGGAETGFPAALFFYHSIFQGSKNASVWDSTKGVDGGGNLDTSMFYTDSANGNYIPAHCSPNIDAGSNQYLPMDFLDLDYDGDTTELLPIDLFGRPRLQNGTVDMGAFEGSSSSDTVEAKLCYGDTLSVAGNLITRQGVSLLSFPRTGLCDSLVYYDVESPINPKITVNATNKTLIASISNAKYQWYDCTNAFALPGDTNQVFSPWVPSSYSVIITENGCTDTSECVNVTQVGLPEKIAGLKTYVFPNPSSGLFNLQFSEDVKNVDIQIIDLNGRVILEKELNTDNGFILDITNKPTGIYILRVLSGGRLGTFRIVKN